MSRLKVNKNYHHISNSLGYSDLQDNEIGHLHKFLRDKSPIRRCCLHNHYPHHKPKHQECNCHFCTCNDQQDTLFEDILIRPHRSDSLDCNYICNKDEKISYIGCHFHAGELFPKLFHEFTNTQISYHFFQASTAAVAVLVLDNGHTISTKALE